MRIINREHENCSIVAQEANRCRGYSLSRFCTAWQLQAFSFLRDGVLGGGVWGWGNWFCKNQQRPDIKLVDIGLGKSDISSAYSAAHTHAHKRSLWLSSSILSVRQSIQIRTLAGTLTHCVLANRTNQLVLAALRRTGLAGFWPSQRANPMDAEKKGRKRRREARGYLGRQRKNKMCKLSFKTNIRRRSYKEKLAWLSHTG